MTAYVTMDRDEALSTLIRMALAEDVGSGDWTTLWTVPRDSRARARIIAREDLVVAGTAAAARVFRAVDDTVEVEVVRGDGTPAPAGAPVLTLSGRARPLLTAERTALNFLGHLSGIATHTRRHVDRARGTGARVVDTRKTLPGWRLLEKEAVRAGGGENHRMGLHDMVLVKENHIVAAGGIGEAVRRVRAENQRELPVEVEVRSLDELDVVLELDVDRVLLDNMDDATLAEAVRRARRLGPDRPELEASGNLGLDRIRTVAETGVDLMSVGALTHSAPVADLSMLVEQDPAS